MGLYELLKYAIDDPGRTRRLGLLLVIPLVTVTAVCVAAFYLKFDPTKWTAALGVSGVVGLVSLVKYFFDRRTGQSTASPEPPPPDSLTPGTQPPAGA